MRFRASIVAHYKFRKSEHYGGNSRIWPKNHSAHYSWSAIKCQRHDLRVWANSFACWRLKTPALHYYIHFQCAPFVPFFVSRDQLPFVSLFTSTLCFSLPLNILLLERAVVHLINGKIIRKRKFIYQTTIWKQNTVNPVGNIMF